MNLAQAPTTDVLTQLVIALSVLLIGWYVVGAQIGRREATRLAHLAAELLRPLGGQGSFRWLGSAGCEIRLNRVRKPFNTIQAVVWLEPREMLPIWLINRWRGRRDLIALAADLRNTPATRFELVDARSAVGRRALRKAMAWGWTAEARDFAERAMTLAAPDLASARRAVDRITTTAPFEDTTPLRVAASDTSPHLSVSIARPDALGDAGDAFALWLTLVAETVAPAHR